MLWIVVEYERYDEDNDIWISEELDFDIEGSIRSESDAERYHELASEIALEQLRSEFATDIEISKITIK